VEVEELEKSLEAREEREKGRSKPDILRENSE
jgi:hypothetical protein